LCCAGSSRNTATSRLPREADEHQHEKRLVPADLMDEPCHAGMASAAPMREPEKLMPFTGPRSRSGIQEYTTRAMPGNAPASPAQTKNG